MPKAMVSLTLEETRDGKRVIQVLLAEDKPHIRFFPFIERKGRMEPGWATLPELVRAQDEALKAYNDLERRARG